MWQVLSDWTQSISNQLDWTSGENGHFLFLNRKIVNPAKKKKNQTVCGFWCFSWVQNARKRSFRFAKLELSVSIFLTRNKMFVNIGPPWNFIAVFRPFPDFARLWKCFFRALRVRKRFCIFFLWSENHYFEKITSSEKKTPLTERDLLMLVRKWTFKGQVIYSPTALQSKSNLDWMVFSARKELRDEIYMPECFTK